MGAKILIPSLLRNLTGDVAELEVDATDVRSALATLEDKLPGLKNRLRDEHGEVRPFVNVLLNDEDIRLMDGESTPLNDGDEVAIVPAIGGG